MVVIVEYGMGNLKNVYNALKYLNIPSKISKDTNEIKNADKLILPGVGSFAEAMKNLNNLGLYELIREKANDGTPLLGICLGMQMLFEKGYENGESKGLNLINGQITLLNPRENVKIPHIGWNRLEVNKDSALISNLRKDSFVYYVHSFAATNVKDEDLIAFSSYGGLKVPSIVCKNNIYGAQFHPEKSGEVGLKILKNFGEMVR